MNTCRCHKHMLEAANEGTCLWCGHGDVHEAAAQASTRRRRLPRDLGALAREGRRPDPRLDNVVPSTPTGVVVQLSLVRPEHLREEAA